MELMYHPALLGLLICTAVLGCSSPARRGADARLAANRIYEEAVEAFEAKQYDTAEPKLSEAIDLRGLNFDTLCSAHVKRAVCWAAAGRYDESLAELQEVEAHGGDQAEVQSARSYVFRRMGDEAKARRAWIMARRLNPMVREFRD